MAAIGDGAARTGVLRTPRGDIRTPAFMPVGTAATVKALTMDQVRSTGADIILGNTVHLMLRPGAERVKRLGGLHRFSGWSGPILTDSGGFQVMSLSKLTKVTEEAATFASPIDGSRHVLTPERSIEIQADLLGSDIVMQLDECVAWPATEVRAAEAMRLSARWGARCKAAFGTAGWAGAVRHPAGLDLRGPAPGIQRAPAGDRLRRLRPRRPGGRRGTRRDVRHPRLLAVATLPPDRPRYLMGVGKPIDIVEAVARGVDMFDCVMPTRSGRHGQAWTWSGPVNLKAARFAEDDEPLDP